MKSFNDDNYCFVCGANNPMGLKIPFHYDEKNDEMIAKTIFPKHFQGWEGVLHGGLISTVLDEIMVKLAEYKGIKCVTTELNVKFKKPALITNEFTLRGKITHIRKRIIFAEGSISTQGDRIVASASGKFFIID